MKIILGVLEAFLSILLVGILYVAAFFGGVAFLLALLGGLVWLMQSSEILGILLVVAILLLLVVLPLGS